MHSGHRLHILSQSDGGGTEAARGRRAEKPAGCPLQRSEKICVEQRRKGGRGLFARLPITRGEILIDFRDAPVLASATRTSLQIDEDRHIEGSDETNAFLNHSCEPTAYYDYEGVYLRALRDIVPGEKITVNYNAGEDDLFEKFHCECGSSSCLGDIRGFRHLTREQQWRLEPLLAPYLRRRLEERR